MRPADLVASRAEVAPVEVVGKVCSKCRLDLPLGSFGVRADGRRRQSWCLQCTNRAVRAWRARK